MSTVPAVKPDPPLYFNNGKALEEFAHPKVVELWRREQFEQRTPEWFEARMKGISASDCALALTMDDNACDYFIEHFNLHDTFEKNPKKCCNKYSTTKTIYEKKCMRTDTSSFTTNKAMLWGQKYEAIVQTIYSQMKCEDVIEFGLLFHPKVPFLMASPDGITSSGTMLEIKCPSQRKVGPVPPLYYFHQMLMQLECCELENCDFFDCSFQEYLFEEEWLEEANAWWENKADDVTHHIYGILLQRPEPVPDGVPKYTYAPPTIRSPQEFLDWSKKIMETTLIDEEVHLERAYYKLDDYYLVPVKRSPDFLERNYPKFKEVWERIEYFRSPQGEEAYKEFMGLNKKKKKDTVVSPTPVRAANQTTLTQFFKPSDATATPAPSEPPTPTETPAPVGMETRSRKKKVDPPFTQRCLC